MFLLPSVDFFKLIFSKYSFRNIIRVSKGLTSVQDRHFVAPDLGQTVCKGYRQTTKIPASKESWLVGLMLYIPINSCGHVMLISSSNQTFFLGKLD